MGLEELTTVGGTFGIYGTYLTDLRGMESLISIGGNLDITYTYAMTDLTGLEELKSIGGFVLIYKNLALTSLEGMNGVSSVKHLTIQKNPVLTNLNGLEALTSITLGIGIFENESLTSLEGLGGETAISGSLGIVNNVALTSLEGLENAQLSNVENLNINNNVSLTNCEAESICNYLLSPNGEIRIYDNAVGCNSPEEVLDSCEAHAGYTGYGINYKDISLYPNPAYQQLNISIEGYNIDDVTIYTLTGQQLMQERPVGETIEISHLQPGMYIVEVIIENTRFRKKLLVQR